MLDYFRARMRVIEEEFGRKFLENKSDHELKPSGKGQHPVRFHWREARRFLRGTAAGQKDFIQPSLALISMIADTIEATRELPRFDSEIRPRLKLWQTFNAANYEMLIAQKCLSLGAVEFVSTGKRRTPDLKVSREEESVFVECQRKERILPALVTKDSFPRLGDRTRNLLSLRRAGLDVVIFILGTDEPTITEVLEDAEKVIASGQVGPFYNDRLGACVSISERVPQPPHLPPNATGVRLSLPVGLTHGMATLDFRIDEQGVIETKEPTSVQVRALNSHSFGSMLNSFNEKQPQIAKGDTGVLCFDVDLSRVHPGNSLSYMEIIARMLGERAWRGGENTRIGGLLFTALTIHQIAKPDGWRYLECAVLSCLTTRKQSGLPNWFSMERCR